MAGVAQLVRASGCGPEGRGFKPHLSPQIIFHTLPFLFSNIHVALTLAYLVVGVELVTIAYIRYRYFDMKFWLSVLQVVVGGALVFLAGILIGTA
jgi:intracellular septation protein A